MKERKLICAKDDGWVKDDEFQKTRSLHTLQDNGQQPRSLSCTSHGSFGAKLSGFFIIVFPPLDDLRRAGLAAAPDRPVEENACDVTKSRKSHPLPLSRKQAASAFGLHAETQTLPPKRDVVQSTAQPGERLQTLMFNLLFSESPFFFSPLAVDTQGYRCSIDCIWADSPVQVVLLFFLIMGCNFCAQAGVCVVEVKGESGSYQTAKCWFLPADSPVVGVLLHHYAHGHASLLLRHCGFNTWHSYCHPSYTLAAEKQATAFHAEVSCTLELADNTGKAVGQCCWLWRHL